MPPSYCRKLIAVMNELQLYRKGSAAFAGKQGFITLRDLFRWGERYRLAEQHKGVINSQVFTFCLNIAIYIIYILYFVAIN